MEKQEVYFSQDFEKVLDKLFQNKDEISNMKLNLKNLTDNQLTKNLKNLNLITKEQAEDEGLIEEVVKTIDIISNKGGSIPDALIPRGKGYLYPHDYENRVVSQPHSNHALPDYYQPVDIDGEKSFAERYLRVQQILKKASGF